MNKPQKKKGQDQAHSNGVLNRLALELGILQNPRTLNWSCFYLKSRKVFLTQLISSSQGQSH